MDLNDYKKDSLRLEQDSKDLMDWQDGLVWIFKD